MKKDIGIVGPQYRCRLGFSYCSALRGYRSDPGNAPGVGTLAAELILTCIGKTDYKLFGI